MDDRIAIVDLADDLQVRKQRIFKVVSRLGIQPTQRREPSRGNQLIAMVSGAEAAAIRADVLGNAETASPSGRVASIATDDTGFFYLIQLEPAHDTGRFKVGFTMDLDGRLQKHRCSAPFATYVQTWPCRRGWEKAAIDCATAGCEQLHTEVFRAPSVDDVVAHAEAFFRVMPTLSETVVDDEASAAAG